MELNDDILVRSTSPQTIARVKRVRDTAYLHGMYDFTRLTRAIVCGEIDLCRNLTCREQILQNLKTIRVLYKYGLLFFIFFLDKLYSYLRISIESPKVSFIVCFENLWPSKYYFYIKFIMIYSFTVLIFPQSLCK
jgi:hypothetical protein